MNHPFIGFVLTTLAITAYGSDDDPYACPLKNLSTATYTAFSQEKDKSMSHELQSMNCYSDLLENATNTTNPQATADIIALGIPEGAHPSEDYSEFLESAVLKNPQRLFEALLLVDKVRLKEVIALLRDPLVTDKKDIDASINRLSENPRYAPIAASYKSGVEE